MPRLPPLCAALAGAAEGLEHACCDSDFDVDDTAAKAAAASEAAIDVDDKPESGSAAAELDDAAARGGAGPAVLAPVYGVTADALAKSVGGFR
jgi:hypothetical protein